MAKQKKDEGKRAIKFYLDESVNKLKKDKILHFLKVCQNVENKMLEYYWNNFNLIVEHEKWISFSYDKFKVVEPRIKSHHHQQIKHQVFNQLKSLESNIKNRVKFKFDDKEKTAIYNYMTKFIFKWEWLEKFVKGQMKEFKKDDKKYFEFVKLIHSITKDKNKFDAIKKEIEDKFYEIKEKYFKQPIKKEFQIWCNTAHTVKNIHMKQFQWIFEIDSNEIIGGTEKKPVFDKIIIPVKFSNYHKKVIGTKSLSNSFNLKLNKYGRIEITAIYDEEIKYPEPKPQDIIGIDIGLNNLIVTSDGEFIEQNKDIVKRLKKIVKQQSNRDKLQAHLRKKYNDDTFELSSKHYNKRQRKLSQFIKCHNRYLIKNFLKSRPTDHIIIEDLDAAYSATKSRIVNFLLKRISIQSIKNYIIEYGKKLGVKITPVNSAYTSQQCSACGYTHKSNRKTQETFSCVKCGFECNADLNASINIRNRYFDKRIKLSTPLWRIREILGIE